MKKLSLAFLLIGACLCNFVEATTYNGFESNPYITPEAREKIRPFLLPHDHPVRSKLDKLFKKSITKNERTFTKAGFVLRHRKQPRSYIHVAGHEQIDGYLVKIHLDDEEREKHNRPSWLWFVRRCQGAKKIAQVIEEKGITRFAVAKKWIYPLPYDATLPEKTLEKRKWVLLVVEDMQVVSHEESGKAWKKKMTPGHLKDLHEIMTAAGGRSYRPDNIPYTRNKLFAFIDTEYPKKTPLYQEIETSLSSAMKAEWNKILKKAGH